MKKHKVHSESFDTLDKVTAQKAEFLFYPFIIFGMICVIEGDPNIGKSYLVTWLACVVSIGGLLPDEQRAPCGRVLYLSAEDDPAYTIRPRVDAMGGDPSRIHYMKTDLLFDKHGLSEIREECQSFGIDVIVVDPLISFMPHGTDLHNSTDIRVVLGHLKRLAQDTGAAIVIVRHLTKTRREKAIYQGQGTVDVIAAARSACLIARHPEDTELKVMAHIKHNVSPQGPSYAFRLVSRREGKPPVLQWEGTVNVTPEELLAIHEPEAKAIDCAVEFLQDILSHRPMPASTIQRDAEARGISHRTIDRAKRELGVRARKDGKIWIWSLPNGKHKERQRS